MEEVPLRFRDPLTLRPIAVPVRGDACTHIGCMDLRTYLSTNSGPTAKVRRGCLCAAAKSLTVCLCPIRRIRNVQPRACHISLAHRLQWKCPLCKKPTYPAQLWVDSLQLAIMMSIASGASSGTIADASVGMCRGLRMARESGFVPQTPAAAMGGAGDVLLAAAADPDTLADIAELLPIPYAPAGVTVDTAVAWKRWAVRAGVADGGPGDVSNRYAPDETVLAAGSALRAKGTAVPPSFRLCPQGWQTPAAVLNGASEALLQISRCARGNSGSSSSKSTAAAGSSGGASSGGAAVSAHVPSPLPSMASGSSSSAGSASRGVGWSDRLLARFVSASLIPSPHCDLSSNFLPVLPPVTKSAPASSSSGGSVSLNSWWSPRVAKSLGQHVGPTDAFEAVAWFAFAPPAPLTRSVAPTGEGIGRWLRVAAPFLRQLGAVVSQTTRQTMTLVDPTARLGSATGPGRFPVKHWQLEVSPAARVAFYDPDDAAAGAGNGGDDSTAAGSTLFAALEAAAESYAAAGAARLASAALAPLHNPPPPPAIDEVGYGPLCLPLAGSQVFGFMWPEDAMTAFDVAVGAGVLSGMSTPSSASSGLKSPGGGSMGSAGRRTPLQAALTAPLTAALDNGILIKHGGQGLWRVAGFVPPTGSSADSSKLSAAGGAAFAAQTSVTEDKARSSSGSGSGGSSAEGAGAPESRSAPSSQQVDKNGFYPDELVAIPRSCGVAAQYVPPKPPPPPRGVVIDLTIDSDDESSSSSSSAAAGRSRSSAGGAGGSFSSRSDDIVIITESAGSASSQSASASQRSTTNDALSGQRRPRGAMAESAQQYGDDDDDDVAYPAAKRARVEWGGSGSSMGLVR